MNVGAEGIRTVMSSARLHVAETEKGGRDCWSKVCKDHVVTGWEIGKVTRVRDRA